MDQKSNISRSDIQNYTGLIIHFAKKFEKPGHHAMNREDLIQEGWMVFSRCKAKYGDRSREEFDRLLMKSLSNQMTSMSIFHQHPQRAALMVDLEDGVENFGGDTFDSLAVNESIEQMAKLLDPTSIRVLEQLLSPSPEVIRLAEIEQMRKKHVRRQGVSVINADTLSILDRHIGDHLGLSRRDMSFHRDEIRIAGIRVGLNK